MQMNDMILASVDDHVCEPGDMWDGHVPAKWKDRAPRLLTKVDGGGGAAMQQGPITLDLAALLTEWLERCPKQAERYEARFPVRCRYTAHDVEHGWGSLPIRTGSRRRTPSSQCREPQRREPVELWKVRPWAHGSCWARSSD
jgi:hypothetical protein